MNKELGQMTIFELLNRNDNRLFKGATDELISDFERIHGVCFPKEYRDILKYTNGADLFDGDITLYSLYDENNTVKPSSLLGMANSPIIKKSIPDELFVIGVYNFGDLVCLNLNTGTVVQWSHEDNEVFLESPSIREWMIFSIEEMNLI